MPVDHAAVERLLSWDGIGKAFIRRIETFEGLVRSDCPYRPDHTGAHLVDSIGHELGQDGEQLTARVGANPHGTTRGYALMVHEGTKPHQIRPRPPRRALRFKVAGRTVIASRVNHPGTKPDRFLTRWIKELV